MSESRTVEEIRDMIHGTDTHTDGTKFKTLRFPIEGGGEATLRVVYNEPGDVETVGPMIRSTWTITIGPDPRADRVTHETVISAAPIDGDDRGKWEEGAEGQEVGWHHHGGSGYVYTSTRTRE